MITEVVDNGPMNIFTKFEACILKYFREKSLLAHIDPVKSRNGFKMVVSVIRFLENGACEKGRKMMKIE